MRLIKGEFVTAVFVMAGVLTIQMPINAMDERQVPPGFVQEENDAGRYLMLEGERTLYWNEREFASGSVTCVEDCTNAWPPVEVQAGLEALGDWSIVSRPDGSAQWAYKDKLLYTSINDTFPGSRLGAGTAWKVLFEHARLPAGMSIQDTLVGRVLADHQGRTLYMKVSSSADKGGPGDTGNAELWHPFEAPMLANGQRDWTVEVLENGMRQWFYKGSGLYFYEKDKDPQDVYGHMVDDAWSAVVLELAPGRPDWITVQQVGTGRVYADQSGKTLYAPMFANSLDGVNTCLEECMQENWRPVYPEPDDVSIGSWVIIENESGERQWSHNHRPVYTHTKDEGPGDMNGDGFGIGYRLFGGWRVIAVSPGILPSGS